MQVVVSVGGTWHAPHLCYQLEKRGMLGAVFTTIPKQIFMSRASIERGRIHWIAFPELFGSRFARMLRIPSKVYRGSPYLHAVALDRWVSTAVSSFQPDIFVGFAWYGLASFRACKSRGVLTVVERGSAHTVVREQILDEEYSRLGVENLRTPLEPKIIERELQEYEIADYIGVPSNFAAESFVEMGVPHDKLLCIPYGVDSERFKPATYRDTRRFRILTVGNLGVEKGTGYLLDSIAMLNNADVELVLVGSLDRYITQRLRSWAQPWVFLGHVQQHQLAAIYNSASVYCLLSVQEGMSMTVLEAMACGLPVIASTNTGAADFIEDGVNGFVVPIRDPAAVAEKIWQLYHNPDLRVEIGRRARQAAVERPWEYYGGRITSAYEACLNPKRS